MSILSDAHDFKITASEFIGTQNIHNGGPNGIDILFEASVADAAVDADARQYEPSCFPGTREQFIHDITHWGGSSDETTARIYWMRGPAGVGKSAIAQTCAEKVKDAGLLGAAFFFSINGRDDSRWFFNTLAYQLSTELADYRSILNTKISNDRSLVTKRLSSQFNYLIVEPLRQLEKDGKGVGRRAIFVDGLDECRSKDAQCEIIDIIAASIHSKSTPFRWVIFSRPEPHIEATFNKAGISPLCHRVLLPISREADREIELYLRGEFENILRRRNLLSMTSSWPSNDQIQKLVDASAGLYAYAATVLRFIEHHPSLRLENTLRDILSLISYPSTPKSDLSPFAQLDVLYRSILGRVPRDALPPVQLLLAYMTLWNFEAGFEWFVALLCNGLGFSESEFRGIFHHLPAVLELQDSPGPLVLDKGIDQALSCFEQVNPSGLRLRFNRPLGRVNGVVRFHHKSFFDFLTDPSRSMNFCIATPAMRERLFSHYIERHHHFARDYMIHGSKLSLAPGFASFTSALSWPHGTRYIDSFFHLVTFSNVSLSLSHNGPMMMPFLSDFSSNCLRKLADFDYRKFLASDISVSGIGLWEEVWVVGSRGINRVTTDTIFNCLRSERFKSFNSVRFLELVKRFENSDVIKSYHPSFPSGFASIYRSFHRQKRQGKRYGQYKLGHGDKAIYWYWEFDVEEEYFHEFKTMDFAVAMRVYQAAKSELWQESWIPQTFQSTVAVGHVSAVP